MKKLLLILSLCVSSLVFAYGETSSGAAIKWLKIVDAGNYTESWQQAGDFFKSQIDSSEWDIALQKTRTPLGKLVSRTVKTNKQYSSLPGVSMGEYVVIQFQTEFTNKKTAIETLTLSKNSGDWLPIGYFIN